MALLVLLSSCYRVPGAVDYRGARGAPRLAVVGHSIPHSALKNLDGDLGRLNEVRIVTQPGADMVDALPWVISVAADEPEVVVVALGENDLIQLIPGHRQQSRIDAIVHRLNRIPCIVWVNARDIGHPFYGDDWTPWAQRFNTRLDRVAEGNRRIHIADWAGYAHDVQGWFLSDRLHLNARGQTAYAEFVDAEVTRLCGGPTAELPTVEDVGSGQARAESGADT